MSVNFRLVAPKGCPAVSIIEDDPTTIRFVARTGEIARASGWLAALDAISRLVSRGYWIDLS